MARGDCLQRRRWSWGGAIYSAMDGPGGPILGETTYSMTGLVWPHPVCEREGV